MCFYFCKEILGNTIPYVVLDIENIMYIDCSYFYTAPIASLFENDAHYT